SGGRERRRPWVPAAVGAGGRGRGDNDSGGPVTKQLARSCPSAHDASAPVAARAPGGRLRGRTTVRFVGTRARPEGANATRRGSGGATRVSRPAPECLPPSESTI